MFIENGVETQPRLRLRLPTTVFNEALKEVSLRQKGLNKKELF